MFNGYKFNQSKYNSRASVSSTSPVVSSSRRLNIISRIEKNVSLKSRLLVSLILFIIPNIVMAQDMKLESYEQVEDCKYPSTTICIYDEHGQPHCQVIQSKECK